MVYVPAGPFGMGSGWDDPNAEYNERPQHEVHLDAFWIDRTEVTIARYRQCIDKGVCGAPVRPQWSELYDDADPAYADYPVVTVDWRQADDYCRWAGKRLPTEAEWEKAARGTDGRIYPWGSEFDGARLNYCDVNCEHDHRDVNYDDGYAHIAPVGSYLAGASPYGALDMAGNVWEWVADWWHDHYYEGSPKVNPQGPDSGPLRPIRSGSWTSNRDRVRSTARNGTCAFSCGPYGFRCAASDFPPGP